MTENLYTPDCIRTFTGKYVNVFNPTPEMLCIEDIAHALSMQPRFGGHLPRFYSVAEHSVHCVWRVIYQHRLAALLHDASEAYLMDIPKPIKLRLTNYKEIEDTLMKLIAQKFGFQYPLHPDIKKADTTMLELEWKGIMLGETSFPTLTQQEAKDKFLKLFNELNQPQNKK